MRIRAAVSIGLLVATFAIATAHAGTEIYLNGGLAASNLRGDAELFGQGIAQEIQDEIGGVWTSSMKSRLGIDGGIGVSFGGPGALGGAIELRYVTRGAKYELVENTGSGFNATGTLKFNFVEVPFLLKVSPPASGSVRPVFVLGPVLGVKSSADFEIEAEGESQSIPLSEGVKSTAFAGLVGAGMRFGGSARSSFEMQARYQLGFTNLIDDPSVVFKSSGFSILAGWSWALGVSE